MRAQTGTSGWRIRLDGVTLIKQALVVELLQEPPECFDVTVIVSDVWIVQVHPITHLMSKVGPFLGKLHHVLAASSIVFGYRDCLADVFLGDTHGFFYTEFYRKPVCVPTCLTFHLITLHGLVTAECILNGAGHYVVNTRHTVCRRRTFVEYERRTSFTFCHTFGEYIIFVPLCQHFLVHL